MLAQCVASEMESNFIDIDAAVVTSKWVGDQEKIVDALFKVARAIQPTVIFIDEIDSLLSRRGEFEGDSNRRLKTQFLTGMSGATTKKEDCILVIGATNRPHELDEAARRRFETRLYVPLPELCARQDIIRNLLSQEPNTLTQADIKKVGQKLEGYSAADVCNVLREAAMFPLREIPLELRKTFPAKNVRKISVQDVERAVKKIRSSVAIEDLQQYEDYNMQFAMAPDDAT